MEKEIDLEIRALISLADDPDENIYQDISGKIISYGLEAIPFLEEKWDTSIDPLLQKRIPDIIHSIQFKNICTKLGAWVQSKEKDLFDAFTILTQYKYPDLDVETMKDRIATITHSIWLEFNDELTPLEKVKLFNHFLYDVHAFDGNHQNGYSLHNMFLNTLLESRQGNPLTLGILYLIIGRQLLLPLHGVIVPGYFMLAYTNQNKDDHLDFLGKDDILFYIHPYMKGELLSKTDVELMISVQQVAQENSFFQPAPDLDIIRRHIIDLASAYEKMGDNEKVEEMEILSKIVNS